MLRKNRTAYIGYGILALAAAIPFVLPDRMSVPTTDASGPLPATVTLNAMLRDFDTTHGDFGVVPTKGLGHYAGTVRTTLGPDDLPEFASGSGYKVDTQWTNADGIPIAPHLFGLAVNGPAFFVNGEVEIAQGTVSGVAGDAIIVTNSTKDKGFELKKGATLNGSVYIGAGGDPSTVVKQESGTTITGEIGVLGLPFEMPTVEEPADMPPNQGDKTYSGGVLTGDLHFDKLKTQKNRTVTVTGDTRILCDELEMDTDSVLVLAPGATLEIYVRKHVDLKNGTRLNVTPGNPADVTLYFLDSGTMKISNAHEMHATIIGPEADLQIENAGRFRGSFIVDRLKLNNGTTRLEMMSGATLSTPEGCGVYEDVAGTRGVSNSGAISSPTSFGQWFKDDLDANLSVVYPITLTNDGSGEYRFFVDKDFYPLDDQGKGNEGEAHNSHFTYTLAANFQHCACEGKYVEFHGGDGAWIFIDGRLAIDLGGVQAGQFQRIELDRLGLTDGETYTLHLFYANRNASASTFGLRTNLLLWQNPFLATATNPFD